MLVHERVGGSSKFDFPGPTKAKGLEELSVDSRAFSRTALRGEARTPMLENSCFLATAWRREQESADARFGLDVRQRAVTSISQLNQRLDAPRVQSSATKVRKSIE